jgi:hypothetical protein
MKRLTPMDRARARGPISHLSLSARDPGGVSRVVDGPATRPGGGWFSVTGENFISGRRWTWRSSAAGSPASRPPPRPEAHETVFPSAVRPVEPGRLSCIRPGRRTSEDPDRYNLF